MKNHFLKYRKGIIGIDTQIPSLSGDAHTIVYADWTASGRNYLPIEVRIQEEIMPWVANTHTETSSTGMAMTHAYHTAQKMIKKHVNAGADDRIITATSGMTRLVNKFQRIIGIRVPAAYGSLPAEEERPVIFITHMEHHSNQTSWLETIATVVIIDPTSDGLVDLNSFKVLLEKYKSRSVKIASVTACSNVTGITTPYHEIAKIIHAEGGYCFVDFACSAPYVNIDMHPVEEGAYLDAIFFSPHKFLGGPGSAGVLVFNEKLYKSAVPDNSGGGTVDWTNPWGGHKYITDIEAREDGGTPAFLQTIKTALCVQLKEEMGVENILAREHDLLKILWDKLTAIPTVQILAAEHSDRLPIVSFYIDDLHFNLAVKLLNDKFGIQSRGGCSCAGTYGHYLMNVLEDDSKTITDQINKGNYYLKPGWVRVSLHPTMTEEEVLFIADGITELAKKHKEWTDGYSFDPSYCSLTSEVSGSDDLLKQQMTDTLTREFVSFELEHQEGSRS
jgi:selenocysteine lyase/cysteine desulfurase